MSDPLRKDVAAIVHYIHPFRWTAMRSLFDQFEVENL